MRKALDTKVKLQDKRLQENKAKKAKEQDVERKKTLKGGKKLGLRSNVFKKPELAFSIPGIGVLGSVLTFFSFVFVGWMLKALPQIQKSIKEFMKRAQTLIDMLTGFFTGVKNFIVAIFSAIELVAKKLGFGGPDGLKEGDVEKTKDDIKKAKDSLQDFITNFPAHISKFMKGIGELFQKNPEGKTAGERNLSGKGPVVMGRGANGSLKAKIRSLEAGGNYAAVFTGYLDGFARRNEDITKMTIAQVVKYQKDYIAHQRARGIPESQRSAAVGAYQMLYPEIAASKTGVPMSALFNKENQDKMAEYYLNVAGQQAYLRGDISAGQYNDRLAGQFASIKKMSGGGVYDTDGINKAYGGVYQEILDNKPDTPKKPGSTYTVSGVTYDSATGASINAPMSMTPSPDIERAEQLARSGGKKKVVVNETVPIDVSYIKSKEKAEAIAAASQIKIEVIGIDGTVTESGGLFD